MRLKLRHFALLILAALLSHSTGTFAGTFDKDQACPSLPQAEEYKIVERVFAIGIDFSIETHGDKIARIDQKHFIWGTAFTLKTAQDELIATAKARVFSWGVKVDVEDCNGNRIGMLDENVIRSMFSLKTIYSLYDSASELQGQSKELNFVGTDITFYNSSKKEIASLNRRVFNPLADKWTLKISSISELDPSLMFFTAAYKTLADKEREEKNEDEKRKGRKGTY